MKVNRNVVSTVSRWAMLCAAPAAVYAEPGTNVKSVILVPARAIYPGDVIARDVVVEQPYAVSQNASASYLTKFDDGGEMVARRTLLPGQPIPLAALRKKALVVQGRTYALRYRSENIEVNSSAFALQAGAVGDIINARNADTGIVIKARIAADQTLVVEAP